MVHWKSYLASFFLVLTVGLLWLFASQSSEARWRDRHPNGIIARVAERRAERWERIQEWHRQHDGDGKHRPQPQPQPQPVPVPTPPAPVLPPAPINPPKPPTPDPAAAIAAGHLWLVEVVPSLTTLTDTQAAVVESPNVLKALLAKGNHRYLCDPSTAPISVANAVQRAIADGLPRAILLDDTKPVGAWIVGSIPLDSEANIMARLKAYQGATTATAYPAAPAMYQTCPANCPCH